MHNLIHLFVSRVACDNVVPSRSESEAGQAEQQSPRKNSKLTKDQRREIRKKAQETEKSREGGNSEYPDITIEDLTLQDRYGYTKL